MSNASHSSGSLKRQLGIRTATALVIGEVVGIGIFLTPAQMEKAIAAPMWLLVVWLLMGVMALCGALCYGELATRFPEAGGGYVYLREAYGRPLAFLYGWMAFLVMDPGLTAALAVGMTGYIAYFVNLPSAALKAVATGSVVGLAALNVVGVRSGAWILRTLTAMKIAIVIILVVWGFGSRLGTMSNFTPLWARPAGAMPLPLALGGGLMAAFFSLGGWWDVTKMAGEVKDPAYVLPRALIYGVTIVTVLFILASSVFLYLVPPARIGSSEAFAAQAGEALFGRFGGQVFSGAVIITVLGSLAAIIMAAPRVYFAMARDSLFIRAAARVHPRFGTPSRAIALQAILASLLIFLGNFDQIVAYFVFTVVVFLGLTVAGLFILRRHGTVPDYRTPGYPFTPAIFLLLVAFLLVLLGASNPKQAFLGVGVVALGLPFYCLLMRGKHAVRNR